MTRPIHPAGLVTVAALLALASWPRPCACQDESNLAMTIFEAGRAYYNQGKYEKALEQFEEAYRLQPLPELLYNIGQCHERLQDYPKAIEAYRDYLDEDPETQDRQAVEEKIKSLEEKLAKTGILLTVSEEGATVVIDGVETATTPVTSIIRTDPGTHILEVLKEGFQTVEMKFSVPVGLSQEIDVKLVPLPGQPDEDGKPAGWYPWTFGVTAALGATAVVTGTLALKKAGDAASTSDPGRYDADRKTAMRLAIATDVLIGLAGAGLVASTAGAIVAARKKNEAGKGSLVVTPLVSHELAGLSVKLTF